MEHIKHYLVIKAPIEKVYEAITSQEWLSNWWTEETIAKPEVGFLNEFKFGGEHHSKMRVKELIQNKSVSWLCEDGDKEWINTTISFNLQSKEGKTILQFAQKNWREATEFYASCNFHWGRYMVSLQVLCETGKGLAYRKKGE